MNHKLTGITLALALAGCAAQLPTVTEQEMAAAQRSGNLETVYENFALQLQGQNLTTAKGQEAKARLNEIGRELALKQEQEVRRDIGQAATASGLVPQPVLSQALAKLPKLQRWEPSRYDSLSKELNELKAKTDSRIKAQQDSLGQLTATEMTQRMAVLDDLALLTGDKRYSAERTEVLAGLRRQADEALQKENYGEARQALAVLKDVNPEDTSVGAQLIQADTKLFEKKFWDALAEGRLDDAYTQFMSLSASAQFAEVLKRLNKSSDDMITYFLVQAGNATTEGKLDEAYKLLSQARDIRNKTQPSSQPPEQENQFLAAVWARYQAMAKQQQPGLAMGYLKVIEAFNADFPGLRAQLRATQDQVLARATKKVSTAAFTDPSGNTEMGGAVAARVTQRVFDKIPNDIKIIERDQFQSILREQGLNSNAVKDDLASADLLIQGRITESRVDTTENRSKKTMRVVTDTLNVPNPAHEKWAALTESERKKSVEPPRTVSQEKREDVTINLQIMRKVGIIAATFRLVDAKTGRVLATGSDTAKAEFTDEGNEGVELGHFRLAFKLATLPSDTEILQKLTEKISEVIGDKLVQELAGPEKRYEQAAQRFADEGDFGAAAEQAAYALALAQQNSKATPTMRKSLEQYAMQANGS